MTFQLFVQAGRQVIRNMTLPVVNDSYDTRVTDYSAGRYAVRRIIFALRRRGHWKLAEFDDITLLREPLSRRHRCLMARACAHCPSSDRDLRRPPTSRSPGSPPPPSSSEACFITAIQRSWSPGKNSVYLTGKVVLK